MFGSTDKAPQPKQRPLGLDESHASTNESARPVPWFAGIRRIGATFISDVFQQKAVSVTQTLGKQKTKTGYNYYASFAAAVCHGPVDGLHDIRLNGDSVYASDTRLQALSLTSAAGVATFTTTNPHGRATGEEVIIEGANQGDYNGSAAITVTSPTAFTYPLLGSPASPATGTITARVKLPPVLRDAENPISVEVLIPDYGIMRLYWGTEAQDVDDLLADSGVEHPPYRGICYAVFDELFLGFNQTNVPNIEFVLSRQATADWHAIAGIVGDANPIAAACELLQHPRAGCGIEVARLNTDDLIVAAARLDGEGVGLSPLLTRQQECRQFLLQLLEYFDGYPVNGADGLLSIGLARPTAGALPVVADADCIDPVKFSPEDWQSAKSITHLKFTNGARAFRDDMVSHAAPFVVAITGEPNPVTLDRSWITKESVATPLVKAAGRVNGLPPLTGTARLRKTAALHDALLPGARFTFNLSTRDLVNQVFRIEERRQADSAQPVFDIKFRIDRSYLYAPLTADRDDITADSTEITADQTSL